MPLPVESESDRAVSWSTCSRNIEMTHAAQLALTLDPALLLTRFPYQQAAVPIPGALLLVAVGSLASRGLLRLIPSLLAVSTPCLWKMDSGAELGPEALVKKSSVLPYRQQAEGTPPGTPFAISGCERVLEKFMVGSNAVSLWQVERVCR